MSKSVVALTVFYTVLVLTSSIQDCSVESLGCWSDSSERAIEGDIRFTSDNPIEDCKEYAMEQGFSIFAVQFNVECFTAANAGETYKRYGESFGCNATAGRGGYWAQNVYRIKCKECCVKSLGCWQDSPERAIKGGIRFTSDNPIADCKIYAMKRGFSIFAVQYNVECFTAANAGETYKIYGKSDGCNATGRGGGWAQNVYQIECENCCVKSMGCWADSPEERAIEGGIRFKSGNPIEECGDYAKKQGFSFFAVQYNTECFTAANAGDTYKKYGKSSGCHFNGRGGGWAQNIYKIHFPCEEGSKFKLVDKEGHVVQREGGETSLLLYDGGTVCDDHFDSTAADAICRDMGYADVLGRWNSGIYRDTQKDLGISLDDVRCGSADWSSCIFSKTHNCGHSEDVFLACDAIPKPGWIAVPLSNYIDFDPENVPLEIQTNSRLGSNERTNLTFYTSQNTYAGGFAIKFSSKPKYLLPHCTSWTKFQKSLPSPTTKIWRIAVQDIDPSVRLVVHCNGEQVLEVTLSDSTCSELNWSSFWRDDVKKIYFNPSDTASDFYKPYLGWIRVNHEFIDEDIEDSPLEIKTEAALGSNEKMFLRFYTDQITDAGGISIVFSSPPQYKLMNCTDWIDFKTNLPAPLEKTWSITVDKSAGIRMLVHCNGELVVDELLSDQMCTTNPSSWSKYWSGYIKIIKFTSEDTASTHYKPTREN